MSKKTYCQYFRAVYKTEFPAITESRKGNNYAFCKVCVCDFVISHGGRSDIVKHVKSKKHENTASISENNSKVNCFFEKSVNKELEVVRAECMFTAFLLEHNLPITAADHTSALFKKMFPDSDIAKKYSCARTKTSAIVKEMASVQQNDVVSHLKRSAFSLSVDGSNDSDSKMYPIVVTYFDYSVNGIVNSLLCLPTLQEDSTGKNIASLITRELNNFGVPFEHLISFCCDNAAVMIGNKNGVASFLKEHQKELIVIGCPCHLINLAAEKASRVLPVDVDQIIVDVFYYLQKSSKRKESLKKFQQLHDSDTRKILKHVCTRWLSLGRALARLIEQWDSLLSFFLDQIKSRPQPAYLSTYKIPKSDKSSVAGNKCFAKNKEDIGEPSAKKQKIYHKVTENKKEHKFVSQEEKIYLFLSSDLNKVYCSFLLNTISTFEECNRALQSASPKIPCLQSMLIDLLKNLFVKFLKPSVIKNSVKITDIMYHDLNNQKCDADLIIGNQTTNLLSTIKDVEKKEFFSFARKYFIAACDYITRKFPLENEVLKHAEVANIADIENTSFNSMKFFIEKFPFLLIIKEGENRDAAIDELQKQFLDLQLEEFDRTQSVDTLLSSLKSVLNSLGLPKYDRILQVLTAVLSIPHSNAECERIFSTVKKNRTMFRSNMSEQTLQNILISKCKQGKKCYETEFSDTFLHQAKKATLNSLK